MTKVRHPLILLAVAIVEGAILAPSFAFGHSNDVLLARLRLDRPPNVTLEIIGDTTNHPLLKEASNPAEVMGQSLRVLLPSGRSWTIAELSKPTVQLHDGFAAPAPIPLQHGDGEPIPEFTTASWTWRPSETPLQFEIPQDRHTSVVFWTLLPESDAVAPGWRMLLSGDKTPPIPLLKTPSLVRWNWQAITALTLAGLGLGLQAALLIRRILRPNKK